MNLQSPHRHLLPREDYLSDSDPLVKVDQLSVNIEAKEASMNGLIDDIITITIDDPCWVEYAKNADLLIIHTIFRTNNFHQPLKLDEPLSLRKLAGEGQLAKLKTCMVWDI